MSTLSIFHLLIALVVREGWELHHMDIKSAFLNDDLQEEVYIEQWMCFIVTGKETRCSSCRR
jgi:hypothetical protein